LAEAIPKAPQSRRWEAGSSCDRQKFAFFGISGYVEWVIGKDGANSATSTKSMI
jgi:hypothetical protein